MPSPTPSPNTVKAKELRRVVAILTGRRTLALKRAQKEVNLEARAYSNGVAAGFEYVLERLLVDAGRYEKKT